MRSETESNPQLVGHDALLAELRDHMARGERAVLTGPPGIGRTALLDRVLAESAAAGRPVTRLAGVAGDQGTPYAALCTWLAGVSCDGLPDAQRYAVDAVLRRHPDPADPLALRLAIASLVPGLLAIDDLHRLDPLTAELVGFLVSAGTGVLATVHLGQWATVTAVLGAGAVPLAVPPLGPPEISSLLDRHGLSCRFAGQVHRASGGNPRLALAIGRTVAGRTAAPGPAEAWLPEPACQVVREWLAAVPGVPRQTLLLAALAGHPTPSLLRRAGCRTAGDDLALAEAAGLVEVSSEGLVRFPASAVGAVVVADASHRERSGGHARLAGAVADEATRLWHRALADDRCDESLAEALGAAAGTARAAGDRVRAAELGLLAADRLPPDGSAAAPHALPAAPHALPAAPDGAAGGAGAAPAGAAADGGERRRTREIGWLAWAAADAAAAGRNDLARRAVAALRRAGAAPREQARAWIAVIDSIGQGMDVDDLDEVFVRALADAAGHPDLLAAVHLRLAIRANLIEGSPQHAVTEARRAASHARRAGDPAAQATALTMQARMQRVLGMPAAEVTLGEALALRVPPERVGVVNSPQFLAARHALFDDRLGEARAELMALLPVAEHAGNVDDLVSVLRGLAEAEVRLGRCTPALVHAYRAAAVAEEAGMSPGPAWYTAAVAELAGGDLHRALSYGERAVRASEEEHDLVYTSRALHVTGLARLAAREAPAAVALLRRVRALETAQQVRDPSLLRWHGDLAEALVETGSLDEAYQLIVTTRRVASRLARPGVLAALDRAEALYQVALGEVPHAAALVRRAADRFAGLGMPGEQARTLIAQAAVERRRRRRAAARAARDEADQIFARIGARPWHAVEVDTDGAGGELTEAETRIAALVSDGASNREIGTALFLSVKTVESALTRIYRKLGVRSRTQLCTTLRDTHIAQLP